MSDSEFLDITIYGEDDSIPLKGIYIDTEFLPEDLKDKPEQSNDNDERGTHDHRDE